MTKVLVPVILRWIIIKYKPGQGMFSVYLQVFSCSFNTFSPRRDTLPPYKYKYNGKMKNGQEGIGRLIGMIGMVSSLEKWEFNWVKRAAFDFLNLIFKIGFEHYSFMVINTKNYINLKYFSPELPPPEIFFSVKKITILAARLECWILFISGWTSLVPIPLK